MSVSRRQLLNVALGALVSPPSLSLAAPQTYPSRPVRIVVGTAAGGAPDIIARLTGQWLSERLGQQFVIENRPGAGSNLATEAVVRAPADGYTILLVASPQVINATLYDNLPFNFVRDIMPVASIISTPLVMQVNPSLPTKSVPEFIAYAKANLGKVNFASAGIGTSTHVAAELFKIMAGIEMVHVPYRGGAPAQSDLIGGQVQVAFFAIPDSIEFIRAGRLRALAVTAAVRSPILPDIPTMGEFLPAYEASTWFGIGVPKNTPTDIVNRLNNEINSGLADPSFKGRLRELGGELLPGSPDDFARFVAAEVQKWGKVIRSVGIRAE